MKTRDTFHQGVTTPHLEVEGNGYESGLPELVAVVDSDAGTCRQCHVCSHNLPSALCSYNFQQASMYCKAYKKFKLFGNIGSHATGFDAMQCKATQCLACRKAMRLKHTAEVNPAPDVGCVVQKPLRGSHHFVLCPQRMRFTHHECHRKRGSVSSDGGCSAM